MKMNADAQERVLCFNMCMHYVYILELENGQYYTGYSANLKTRITRHRQGSTTTTARVKPRDLVFYAAFVSERKARDFEAYLKTKSGWAFRKKHLIDANLRST